MKITVTKISAARSQLIQAIRLFFEEGDPVSIHTLAGASLEILNDHFTDQVNVADNLFIFHKYAPFIKEERRQEIRKIERSAQNFFKHADKDLQQGVTSFEFQTNINNFFIFGALHFEIIKP